ncbi:MFS transporter [Lactobacillus delbrueckii subsp. bulgaricus]|uniref:Permease n=1 Tax=Lactobacillus delbrueckii subsp. bulgaricus (strain ATCC 11842 / DSM 20081 / BCRC 10696 / JCM 1002 / NBRC 13953 / NCIMB 11778 / NCTC 12712 / WDCM 00102 / Lb 14) TaxID=390333 RepID=Q1G7P3_LACDA|nr:MFS transporter [Lactobacillus delbrueckii]KRN37462.1 permease [Lactobacillus delbrueckii subsp. bulgaricus ATCC 11842 = JCM 1002]MBT8926303.1 MFS transporter [Lactobacillus delbrueckii subsp. bulgaricus]MCD5462583.1 MFS transporter [Lactobacillus delbrueckii subsp. bulgaricus]MCD5466725.1 MFS transporter [Lactobacillus delbrueckii subsp. bulgaricus]MCD5478137.1 MFS transporter [Lactobacillus delbrueckii subsp. bulgaricus]
MDNTSPMSTNQKWVLASMSSGFLLENMDVMFLSFSLSEIIAQMHVSSTAGGWIGTFTNLGMFFGGALFGLLGDRIGRVKTFSYTIFLFAIATGLTYFAHNITALYALRFLAGIGAGGEYGVGIALIAENFQANQIGRASSVAAVGGQIGSIVASLLAAWIIPTYGWNTLFLFGVVPVVLTYFVRRHVKESDEFLAAHKKAEETGEKISFGRLFETPRLALQTLGLMLMTIVQIAGYFGLMNWLPSIVQKKQGLSVSGSSYWMIATIIGMSIGIMVFGTIMDKICPRWAFGIFLLGSAVVVFAIVNVTSYWTMLLAGALTGFFSNGMFGGYGAVISQLYPTEIRSTANNLIMNTGRAIGGFSSVIIGALMDHYNLYVVMGFLSALYIISFLVMISLPGLREIQTKKRAA